MKDMRRYDVFLLIGLVVMQACSLQEDPRDQIPVEEAYTSATSLFQNTVATLYAYIGGSEEGEGLQGTCRGVYDLQTFGSDEAMLPTRGGDWYDGGLWEQMYCHSWKAGHSLAGNAWLYLYKVITLCNCSLEQLAEHRYLLTDEDFWSYCAEVRALRAIYYWYLIDLFGNVPIVTSTRVSMQEVKQSRREEVFRFAVNELEGVMDYLPYEYSQKQNRYYGRVTAPVATFALAKLMLNAEVYSGQPQWERTIYYCNILEGMGYKLEPYYTSNFVIRNENSCENIWTIPMDRDLYTTLQQNMHRFMPVPTDSRVKTVPVPRVGCWRSSATALRTRTRGSSLTTGRTKSLTTTEITSSTAKAIRWSIIPGR